MKDHLQDQQTQVSTPQNREPIMELHPPGIDGG